MAYGEGVVQRESTAALCDRTLERLQRGFGLYVQAEAAAREGPSRRDDQHDPVHRLRPQAGFDPITVLGPIAAAGPAWFRETFDGFVRRTDVTLEAFGWTVVETPSGPAYRFAWPD